MKSIFANRITIFFVMLVVLNGLLSSVGHAASGFNIKGLDGKPYALAAYKGKWVLVNFWATWCPPCQEEMPDLILLHDKHKDKDLVVIGIAMDYKSADSIRKFAEDNLISYPLALGDDTVTEQFGSVDALPTTYIYDPQGKLVKLHRGLITRDFVERLISRRK